MFHHPALHSSNYLQYRLDCSRVGRRGNTEPLHYNRKVWIRLLGPDNAKHLFVAPSYVRDY